jgi:putative transposase
VDRRADPEGPRRRPDGERALIATGVNADGKREILGLDVATAEDGAGWLAFLRGLAARGLSGVQLVTSDCHHGLRDAIAAVLPGASWQRCRAHCNCKEITRWFSIWGLMLRYGDPVRCA